MFENKPVNSIHQAETKYKVKLSIMGGTLLLKDALQKGLRKERAQ